MSKKKSATTTLTLKDFHGGSITSDLPLPSAPGVSVMPSQERPTGVSARPERTRHVSASSASISPLPVPPRVIGRNFDEDECTPFDAPPPAHAAMPVASGAWAQRKEQPNPATGLIVASSGIGTTTWSPSRVAQASALEKVISDDPMSAQSGYEFGSPYVISQQNMHSALHQIEIELMTPDLELEPNPRESKRSRTQSPKYTLAAPVSFVNRPIRQEPLHIKQLLVRCAVALNDGKIEEFELLEQQTRKMVSIAGDPIQRVGAYLLEGLVARNVNSGTNIYHTLNCCEPESKELLSYMRILYDICPYFKFGYMAANGAIAEAVRNEDKIHIVDFQIAQGTQWITLIQAFAARPGGPPHVRITGIDDPVSKLSHGEGLQAVSKMLLEMSIKFNIPIEFIGLSVDASEVTPDMLDIRQGEALAVNFTHLLHHTPDESVDVKNPRDGLLRMVKSLSPKVTTIVEQESNTNTTIFLNRFMETLDYYSSMFESIDVTLPRESRERINVEQHCLAKDIVNVIACEGKERVERHELLGKWKLRLTMAGFKPCPLSSYVNSVIKKLLACYSDKYTLVETDGVMLLGWKNRNLISASAWY